MVDVLLRPDGGDPAQRCDEKSVSLPKRADEARRRWVEEAEENTDPEPTSLAVSTVPFPWLTWRTLRSAIAEKLGPGTGGVAGSSSRSVRESFDDGMSEGSEGEGLLIVRV